MYELGPAGWLHLISAAIALASGTFVLAARKGTRIHKRAGYIYALSMLILLGTAFLIYRLFGRFGPFHIMAVVSTLTLAGGMLPALLRRPENWLALHFSFMFWSVFGLYAAFVAELSVRLPIRGMFTSARVFFTTVIVATLLTMLCGQVVFFLSKKRWQALDVAGGDHSSAEGAVP